MSAAVFGFVGEGKNPLRIRARHHRDCGTYRCRWREYLQPGAVRKARAGGCGLPGESWLARGQVHRDGLRQHPACRQQRYRRRQGAESPRRFRGEGVAMAYLVTFHWSWLLASLLLGLAMGWIAVVHRGQGVSKRTARWLAVLAAALVALALARVIPGRPGYWLGLGLILFAFYLGGCAAGSVVPEWAPFR